MTDGRKDNFTSTWAGRLRGLYQYFGYFGRLADANSSTDSRS